MSNESDEDTGLCTSKRPKTKLQTSRNASGTDKVQTDNEDDTTTMKDKTENITISKDNKKAAKRGRESDEESSITSDEETMCKKRVRKDSEEDIRPKKKVSIEARKLREAARSAVEKKKAILDSDSDCESETQLDTHKSAPKNKYDVDISSKGRLLDSGNEQNPQQNCEDSVVKRNKACLKKNEDSSSAYNSDSEANKARKISKGKVFKPSKSNSEYGDSTDDETVSVNAPEKKSINPINNSEDEAGHTSSDWEGRKCVIMANVKLKKTEKFNYGNDTKHSGSEVEEASNSDKKIPSKIGEVELNKHNSKEVKTKTIDSNENNAKLSDDSESGSKRKPSSPRKTDKANDENHQKLSKSLVSSDAESDDIPLSKSHKTTNKTETVEKSSDSDRPLLVSKSGASKKVPFGSKIPLSSDESDSQCNEPPKKTKQTSKAPCSKQKSKKAVSLRKNISSSCDDTSDDDSAKRKTLHKKAKKKNCQ